MTETTDPLLRIERAVRESGGADTFLTEVAGRWPRLRGATIADVLEMTGDYDMFTEVTEPFYAVHGDELPPLGAAVRAALHALIIIGGELTVTRVLRLLSEAGYGPRTAGFDDVTAGRESAAAGWPGALRARYQAGYRLGGQRAARVQMAYDPLPDLAALIDGLGELARQGGDPAVLGALLGSAYARLRGGLLLDEPGREAVSTEAAVREALASFITRTGKLLTPAELDAYAAEAEREVRCRIRQLAQRDDGRE